MTTWLFLAQSLRQVRLNEILLDYSRDAALVRLHSTNEVTAAVISEVYVMYQACSISYFNFSKASVSFPLI